MPEFSHKPSAPTIHILDSETLRTLQQEVATLTQSPTMICDGDGRPALEPSGPLEAISLLQSSPKARNRFAELLEGLAGAPNSVHHPVLTFAAAGIQCDGLSLGTLIVGPMLQNQPSEQELANLASEFHIPPAQADQLRTLLRPWSAAEQENVTHIIRMWADVIARLAGQTIALKHRELELDAVHSLNSLLSGTQDLQVILDTISQRVCEVMQVRASSIRLLDEDTNELVIKSVFNLSPRYLDKGAVLLDDNPIDRAAFAGEAVYVQDASVDPRVRFPDEARKEGIVSGLSVGMTYRGKTVGIMRVYTGEPHSFSAAETALLRTIASQAAAAIINRRLHLEALESQRYARQLSYAGDIQRRMIPKEPPMHPKIKFAHVYDPSFDVGGDYFDFFSFRESGEVGLCIADVVGKGIPAALMMASVRTAFRLYVYAIEEITEVMTMINMHMTRETLVSEFATLFYGQFSANGRKVTYSCAGHDPPLHYRDGQLREMSTQDFVIGVNPNESFSKKTMRLKKNDAILFYTDGAIDAQNFDEEHFGRERLSESFKKHATGSASQIVHNVIWDVRRFVGLADQADDITLVVAKIE